MRLHFTKFFLISAFILIISPEISLASTLYFDPADGAFVRGDKFVAKVKIDTGGECINAIEAEISFSDNLKFEDFGTGESIMNLWISKPESGDAKEINMKKKFSFSGGMPGGYCGSIMGDLGETNILGEAVFSLPKADLSSDQPSQEALLSFSPGAMVFLNDGKGNQAVLTAKEARYSISDQGNPGEDAWKKKMEDDDIVPETFTVELTRDQNIFDGKYFITFNTTDKQTGIDHYEVLEIGPDQEMDQEGKTSIIRKFFKGRQPHWVKAESPFLLEDQELSSDIYVKAIDKAGNEQTVKVKYTQSEEQEKKVLPALSGRAYVLILLIAAAIIAAVYQAYRRRNRSNN